MKKLFLTVIMLLVMIMTTLVFASCGNGSSDSGSVSASGSGESLEQSESNSQSGISGARGILFASVKENGELTITFTDGSTVNLGVVCDSDKAGADDRIISSSRVNDKNELIISFTDGSSVNLGVVGWYEKFVVTINYVNGELRFDYNDGVLTGVIVVSGSDSVCKHINAKYNEQVAHKMNDDGTFENGSYLMVCPDCGYTKTISGVMHSVEKTTYEPTCTKDGYTLPKCNVCGFEFEKERIIAAFGHDYTLRPVVNGSASEAKRWCEEGGLSIQICTRCNEIGEYVTIAEEDAPGHHSDKWTLTKKPSWNNVGALSGVCNVCGNVVERSIPACSDGAYTVSDITPENASCTAEKKGNVEIEIDGQKIVVNDVAIPGSMHTFKGEAVDDSETKVFNSENEFYESGLRLMANTRSLTCSEVSTAYFTCEKCENIIVVTVRKRHASADSSKDIMERVPTCETEGVVRISRCTTCENRNCAETIPAVGHDYSFEWDQDNGRMIGTCQNVINRKVDSCENQYIVYDDIRNVETEVIEAATCRSRGVTRYNLYLNNGEIKSIDVVVPKFDHVLLRADGTTERISDAAGKRYRVDFYPDIKPFGNAVVSCAADFGGYFTCANCNEIVSVTLYKPHFPKEGTSVESPATCVKVGTRSYTCSVCKGDVVDEIYEYALGHDYEWELVDKSESDEKYHLIATCQRERENAQGELEVCSEDGCRLDYPSIKRPVCTVIILPTCSSEGLDRYTITNDYGSVETIEIKVPKLMHKLNGMSIDDTKPILSSVKGVKLFGNSDLGLACGGEGAVGYFTCDECGYVVSVRVIAPHTMPAAIPEDNKVEATCGRYGYISYNCTVCGMEAIDILEPLGHSLSVTTIYNIGNLEMKIACERDDCNYEATYVINNIKFNEWAYNFKIVTNEAATCVKEGLTVYSFALKNYEYQVVRGKVTTVYDSYGNEKLQIEDYNAVNSVDLTGSVTVVTERLDHNYIQTEKLDESGNAVVGADGKPVMIDKIFTFEVVEGTGESARTYIVQSKVCKDCGNAVEIGRYLKPAD